jgi:hypothetical protein
MLVPVEELKAVLGVGDLYPDSQLEQVAEAAEDVLVAYLRDLEDDESWEDYPEVREAALAIAVELWQSRLAPGGQLQAVDFVPGPYRLGRSLLGRVTGLLGAHLNVGAMVG